VRLPEAFARASGCLAVVAGQFLLNACALFQPEAPRAYRATGLSIKDETGQEPIRYANPKAARSYRGATTGQEEGGCGSVEQCALVLRLMVDDPERAWMRQRPSPRTYANGTRLFAFRALRPKLSCAELELATNEVHEAAEALRNGAAGVSSDQVVRVTALSAAVEEELRTEQSGRCVD
jgi:hypothetical protein